MSKRTEAMQELLVPFAPELVQWEPIAFTPTRLRALGYPVVATAHYADRLDAVFPQHWSVAYTPWRDAVICHLTIGSRTMSQTGQAYAGLVAYRTAADDALQRACHLFGLGRYLTQFPQQWENYDPDAESFTPEALDRLAALAQSYDRTQRLQRIMRNGEYNELSR